MLTKQQIADEFKALEAELHAQCTREWNSTHRHVLIKQSEKRRELQDACGLSGHIFKINGRCRDCGASNDRPNVANLGVATGVAAGLSEHKIPIEIGGYIVGDYDARVERELSAAFRVGVDLARAQPAPEVISKAPDALPACLSEPHTLTIPAAPAPSDAMRHMQNVRLAIAQLKAGHTVTQVGLDLAKSADTTAWYGQRY